MFEESAELGVSPLDKKLGAAGLDVDLIQLKRYKGCEISYDVRVVPMILLDFMIDDRGTHEIFRLQEGLIYLLLEGGALLLRQVRNIERFRLLWYFLDHSDAVIVR